MKLTRADWKGLLAVALVAAVCHAPVLRASFAWDDFETHVENPLLDQAASPWHYFSPAFWRVSHPELASPYRPVREFLLSVLWRLGAGPAGYHAVNLAGHTVATALVFLVALRLLGQRMAALAAALIFGLHPSHVETLALTKNAGEIVSVVLALAAMLLYLDWEERKGERWNWARGAGAAVAFGLGLLSKESASGAPLILAAWAALFRRGPALRRALAGLAAMWALVIVYAVAQAASPEIGLRMDQARAVAPGGPLRLILAGKTVLAYLGILAFPFRAIPWREFDVTRAAVAAQAGWLFLGMAAMAGVMAWAAWRWRLGGLALFWTVAAMGPAANLVVNTGRPLADQRLYLPSAGFALLVGAGWMALGRWRWSRQALQGLGLVLCLVYAVAQMNALTAWRSPRALWVAGLRASPNLVGPHLNLGEAYVSMGHYAAAAELFRQAIRLGPDSEKPYINLGGALSRMFRFGDALAVLDQAAQRFPQSAGIWNNIGTTRFRLAEVLRDQGEPGQADDWLRKAAAAFEAAAARQPSSAQAWANLGNCYLELKDLARGREMYEKALSVNRRFAEAHYNFGRLLLAENKPREALRQFEAALEVNPLLPEAWAQVALMREKAGDAAGAERAWRGALDADMKRGVDAMAMAQDWAALAALLEKQGRKADAHEAWLQALRLAGDVPEVLEGAKRTAPQ
ncbi:MAG TPA: tetratricopeptide repeat protein [Candidatus Brocadiia bacterium]|nr:tetratricopeptide repeat protein [Candidatus Brocadiia bacterium]